MTARAPRRRGKPHDLRNTAPSGFIKPRAGEVHDRKAADLLINARVVAVEVDDPMGLNFGDKIVVLRSTRNDPLADLRARNRIEECDYAAGRHWQNAYENSQVGSVRAIDPTREAVDGGRPPENLTDRQRDGAADVDAARLALGPIGDMLVRDILADGLSIHAAAARRGLRTARERLFLGARFRECLGTLAVTFGLAMKSSNQ